MPRAARLLFLGAAVLLLSCDATPPTTPATESAVSTADARAWPRVTVLSQNIYIGCNIDAILAALLSPDPNDDVPTLLAEIQVLYQTDFPTRAAAFAAEVARTRPHFIGLQEVSTIDIDLTPLGGPAYYVEFLPVLLDALEARGLHYAVAGREQNFEAIPGPGIRLVDEDVMLVDTRRVQVAGPVEARTFSNNLGVLAPGLDVRRGFVAVPAIVEGRNLVVASTHLEDDLGPLDLTLLRAAQMQELLQVVGAAPHAIIMGDLNDFAGSPMHQLALGAGFRDSWAVLRPGTEGYTCCHKSDLSNPIPVGEMDQRLDFIFARGFRHEAGHLIGYITRVGYGPADKVPGPFYPLWAADHAGVAATLRVGESPR